MKEYYVYLMSSFSGTLYVGVTSDLEHRVFEHKQAAVPAFTARYTRSSWYITKPVRTSTRHSPGKQIKGWPRAKKVALVTKVNPLWRDLSQDWYREDSSSLRSSE